jgi:hypothetical protein
MPPHNQPLHLLNSTADFKQARPTPAQKPSAKPDPGDSFTNWPPEMLHIINRYPEIRESLRIALEKEFALGHLRR